MDVIASAAKQSRFSKVSYFAETWIAASLRSSQWRM